MRRSLALLAAGAVLAPLFVASPALAAPAARDTGLTVYEGRLSASQLEQVATLGVDREDLTGRGRGADGRLAVEVVLSRQQAEKLTALGLGLTEKRVGGTTVGKRMARQADAGYSVFRSYSEVGGIRDEMTALAAQYPRLTKLVTIGTTTQGKPILALKVTRNASRLPDGRRPAVLYSSTQHAREWITTEMNRRLMHHYLDTYASDAAVRRTVDTRELWFVPVANPDGYDFTFTADNRLWRKTLRDNDGDGVVTAQDGVDPNRNFPYHWGYDNEGSSPNPSSQTYRGPSAASEPETRALDGLLRRIRFAFQINYHSAAELLLYGAGYQVATPTPDDQIYAAMVGDDANPAVPGYDPDLSAELYTTNGETTEHAHETYGTLAFTPEMSTCETASAVDPDDAFDPADCESVFNFPDSEALVQAEFAKNLPFADAVARSAADPADPVSVVGLTPPDFAVDSFGVSYGDPQPVSVTARRDLRNLRMHYSIEGRRPVKVKAREWRGGERYGDELNRYYAEFRGVVRGARPGDRVRVWFTGKRPGQPRSTSESFTYRLAQDRRSDVLVVANEDYEGVNPTYPASVTSPKYARDYVRAVRDSGRRASVWDVSRQGVPDHLGVLGHFDSVVWYLGDNRLTQDPEDEQTELGSSTLADASVAERQEYLTIAVRDYLNEGGKVVHAGETAGYFGTLGETLGGIYYGLNGAPDQQCVVTTDLDDCLILSDDFFQYYLGAYSRRAVDGPTSFSGRDRLQGADGTFGGPAVADNPLDEAGTFAVTSDVLPPEEFPLFRSRAAGSFRGAAGGAFDPVEGSWYAGVLHTDDSYARLTRTVDLGDVTAGQTPTLQARLSYDTEEGYDHVVVEAHPVGSDDWTTLPEQGGLTSSAVPLECEAGFLLEEHPFLLRYLTPGDTACTPTGTSGAWNSMTGSSDGWQTARFDLSAYAGQQVEVSISYVSDPASGGTGLVVDDTRLLVGGTTTQSEGFETGLGPWTIGAPPEGSPTTGSAFRRSEGLLSAAVTTRDSVLLGFGVEQLGSRADRARVLGRALARLDRTR
jgi:hypothetical protein